MGKAWQPPKYAGGFRYHITTHALQRFRERVEDTHRHRPDEDIARLLDQRIKDAFDARSYFEVIDSDRPDVTTTIAVLEAYGSDKDRPHVVLRPRQVITGIKSAGSVPYGPDVNALAAITVLTAEMAAKTLAKRSWVPVEKARDLRPPPAPPTLAARPFEAPLANVQASLPLPAPPTPAPPTPTPPTPTPPPAQTPEPAPSPIAMLPEGWKRPEHRDERRAWARAFFMDRPSATIKEAQAAAVALFGVGLSDLSSIKDEVIGYLARIGRESLVGADRAASQDQPAPIAPPIRVPTAPPEPPGAFRDDEGRLILRPRPEALAARHLDVPAPPAVRDVTVVAAEYGRAAVDVRACEANIAKAKQRIAEAEADLRTAEAAAESAKKRLAELLVELTGGAS